MNYSKFLILFIVSVVSTSFIVSVSQKASTPESTLAGDNVKSWRLIKESFNGNDITALRYSGCNLDNEYKFYSDSRFVEIEGATKCSENAPDSIRVGNWRFTNDKKMLIIESDVDTLSFHIDTLTSTQAMGTIYAIQGNFQSTFVVY
jgi:hypothetical protein